MHGGAPLWMCIPPVRCTSVCVCVTPVPCQIRGHRKYSRQRAQAGPHPNMTHTDAHTDTHAKAAAQHRAPTRWGGQRRARDTPPNRRRRGPTFALPAQWTRRTCVPAARARRGFCARLRV